MFLIFRRQKVALVFRENPSSLNGLIGYAELMVFREICPGHSLIDKEQRVLVNSFILKTFLVAPSNATCYLNFLIGESDRSMKG